MKKIILVILIVPNLILFADMINPVDNSYLNYTHVLFEWDQEINAWGYENDLIEYEIQISTDSNFSSISSLASTSSLIYVESENINWSDTYYWRVRPTYSDGSSGEWIDTFSFTTKEPITSADITLYSSNEYQDGITFLGSLDGNFSAAFDKQGNEIWNSHQTNLIMYNTNLKGELYGCHYEPQFEHSYPAVEFDLDINYIWEEPNEEFTHHDIIRLPDGNYLSIVETLEAHSVPNTGPWYQYCAVTYGAQVCNSNFFPWVGDKLVIWDKDTKEILWEWSTFDGYNILDFDGVYYQDGIYGGSWDNAFNFSRYDWTHVNAVTYSEEENALYISCRHLSRITKIYFDDSNYNNPQNGEVIWNIGTDMPSGDVDCGLDIDFSWQHSISVLDNGNFVILDNGNLSNDFNPSLGNSPVSRALEINPNEIDGGGCNAEIVWEYLLPESLFGHASGNTQKLDNGNYLISTVGDGGTTLEVASNKDLVWEAKYNLNIGLLHRSYRASSLYPVDVSAIALNYNYADGECCGGLIETSLSDSVRVWFRIYNDGTVAEDFEYSFSSTSSSDIWYEEQGGTIEIQPGGYELVSFSGVGSGPDSYNDVELVISSINNHNIVKTYNYIVVEKDDLSNGDVGVDSFNLLDIYPNPFNPSTTISIQVEEMVANADIDVYDINGKLIDTIYSSSFNPGLHSITWNPKNISSGKYFIKFRSNEFIMVKEVLYIK